MCAPIKPGTYLRLRREAAGLSIADVALMISPSHRTVALNSQHILQVEAGDIKPPPSWVDRLATAFRFDRHQYDLLASFDLVMRICRTCGCSDNDQCDDDEVGNCTWSVEREDTCTHCVRREALAAPALPFITA